MTPKYDASKLLYAKSENDRFLHKLNIREQDERLLLSVAMLRGQLLLLPNLFR